MGRQHDGIDHADWGMVLTVDVMVCEWLWRPLHTHLDRKSVEMDEEDDNH